MNGLLRRAVGGVVALGGIVLLAACPKPPTQTEFMTSQNVALTSTQLRLEVHAFADRFSAVVENAADKIIKESDDPEIRRQALLWKMNIVPESQRAAFQNDPLAAMVDLWALCAQMEAFLGTGTGADLLREMQPIAYEAADKLEREAFDLMKRIMGPDGMPNDGRLLYEWVEENPIEGPPFVRPSSRGILAEATGNRRTGAFAVAANLGESVADLSDRLAIYAETMPRQARWQAELVIDDLMRIESVVRTMENTDLLADSLDRTASGVEAIPLLVETQVDDAIGTLLGEMPTVEALIDRQRLATLEAVRAERIAVLQAVREERIAALTDLFRERAAMMEELEAMVQRTVDDSTVRFESLIDYALWRVALLGGAGMLLGFVLAFVVVRFGRPR